MMESEPTMDSKKSPVIDTGTKTPDTRSEELQEASTTIYIEPEKLKAALRKFDIFVPVTLVFQVFSALDNNNIGNAVVFGFDTDLGLVGNDFNNINTVSNVMNVIFEIHWVPAVQRFGVRTTLGTAFILWSLCTLGTAFIYTYTQAIIIRMFLAIMEAGLAQGFAYVYCDIYPRALVGKRIMTENLAQCISGSFGGLFAYAVQTMGTRRGLAAWRWLFIVEFCVTAVVGSVGLLFLPPAAPENTWYLNAEEKEVMRLKRQRDLNHNGDSAVSHFDSKWVKATLTDPFVWLLGIAFFTSFVAINGLRVFLPTIKGLGFASLQANYLTIQVYILGDISLVIQVYFSDKTKQRGLFIIGSCVPVVAGYLICIGTANTSAGYGAMFILGIGIYVPSTLAVTWIATNLAPDSKRAFGMPFAYSLGNLSGLVSSQLYPCQQGPRYIDGNAISAGLTVVSGVLYGACYFLLRRRNAEKAKLTAEGATTNGREGDMSLDSLYHL